MEHKNQPKTVDCVNLERRQRQPRNGHGASSEHRFVATAPRGLSDLLVDELRGLGAAARREAGTSVYFKGPLAVAYRACVESRLANRVLVQVGRATANSADELYEAAQTVTWTEHFGADSRFNVSFTGRSAWLNNSHFGALKVKDAIVDQLRQRTGARPNVDRLQPDVRVHAHLERGRLQLSVDLSAGALYLRKPSAVGAAAPIKENLAAAVLLRAGWPDLARDGAPFLDPFCGSGTLLCEAASMAAGIAPGLLRPFGLSAWRGHDQKAWENKLANARDRANEGITALASKFTGFDADPAATAVSRRAIEALGLIDHCEIETARIDDLEPISGPPGLVCTNPPYGVRLGGGGQLEGLYRSLGTCLRESFPGWKAAVLSARTAPSGELRLARARRYQLFNGAIECELLCAELFGAHRPRRARGDPKPGSVNAPDEVPARADSVRPGARRRADAFANRLRKNFRHLSRWAKRRGVSCYRLYDADLPEYALAIDLYHSDRLMVHAQEYAAPPSVDSRLAQERIQDALAITTEFLGLEQTQLFVKRRERQRGSAQYQRLDRTRDMVEIREGPAKFLVNLKDFLDTGLFLDHRPIRARIVKEARNKRFLNLFAYTGTATVAAAIGGAATSTSVDSSRLYCDWARRNLVLNQATHEHRVQREDCRAWLDRAANNPNRPHFDLVFVDPPTFSNSKSGRPDFDIQRDHRALLESVLGVLAPDGEVYFSTHRRRFRLDPEVISQFDVQDISRQTIDEDFSRRPTVHRTFRLRYR